jgi:hypothetical protein
MHLMGHEAKIEADRYDTTIRAIIRSGGDELYDSIFGEKAEEARMEENIEWMTSDDIEEIKRILALEEE